MNGVEPQPFDTLKLQNPMSNRPRNGRDKRVHSKVLHAHGIHHERGMWNIVQAPGFALIQGVLYLKMKGPRSRALKII
jgi:hypothetical protein